MCLRLKRKEITIPEIVDYINGFRAFADDTKEVLTVMNGEVISSPVSQAIADDYNILIGKRKVISIWLSHPGRPHFNKEDALEFLIKLIK